MTRRIELIRFTNDSALGIVTITPFDHTLFQAAASRVKLYGGEFMEEDGVIIRKAIAHPAKNLTAYFHVPFDMAHEMIDAGVEDDHIQFLGA